MLLSSTKLLPALKLYESLGFRQRPLPDGQPYATADVCMELALAPRCVPPGAGPVSADRQRGVAMRAHGRCPRRRGRQLQPGCFAACPIHARTSGARASSIVRILM